MAVENQPGVHSSDYLLTHFAPKSPDQLGWEHTIRSQAESLLMTHGTRTELPAQFAQDRFYREKSIRRRDGEASRLRWLSWYLRPAETERDPLRVINDIEIYLQSSPLRTISVPAEEQGLYVGIVSKEPVRQKSILQALSEGTVRYLPPPFSIEDCELHFSSSGWGAKNTKVISPAATNYLNTAAGLEIPAIKRQQIEAVLEAVTKYYVNNPSVTLMGTV